MKYAALAFLLLLFFACDKSQSITDEMPVPKAIKGSTSGDLFEIERIRSKQGLEFTDCLRLAGIYAKYDQHPDLVLLWLTRAMELDSYHSLRSINYMLSANRPISKPRYAAIVRSAIYK